MSRARLFLTGIRAEGRHGARTGEKDEPQPFVVDLDLEVEVHDDSIEATADYRVDHRCGPRGHRTAVVRPHRVDGRRDRRRTASVPQVGRRPPWCTSRTRPADSGSTGWPPRRRRPGAPPRAVGAMAVVAFLGLVRISVTVWRTCRPRSTLLQAEPGLRVDGVQPRVGDEAGRRAARSPTTSTP